MRRSNPRRSAGSRPARAAGGGDGRSLDWASRAPGILLRAVDEVSTSLWFLPAVGLLTTGGLSVAFTIVDGHLAPDATAWYLFRGGPDGARQVLASIATSIMTSTGVVFSVTVLTLQLASSQFSPRVLRSFLRDRITQGTLALFIGTFFYALLTMRSVRGASNGVQEFVPSLSVWFAVVLATACVGAFVLFVHHIAQSIRSVNVLSRIGDETRACILRLFPEAIGEDPAPTPEHRPVSGPTLLVLHQGASGPAIAVSPDRICEAAISADVTVALVPALGDFVAEGSTLFEVWGDPSRLDVRALAAGVTVGPERTLFQDPAAGFRAIVDVAERALSPAVNDPTTAVQALDQLHDLLRRLATRRFPDLARLDGEGKVRVILPRPDFDAYVRLSLDEIRDYGVSSVQVLRRIQRLIEDLLSLAPPSRRCELKRQLRALDAARGSAPRLTAAPGLLRHPSVQGHAP